MIVNKPARFGDLKKFVVKIDGKDVSDAVAYVTVFQDLFTPTWSAHVFVSDTANLLMTLPIKVGSKISVQIETDNQSPGDGEKEFEFVIYRLGEKAFQNHMQQDYTLFCASDAFFRNMKKRVSKCYSDMKPTDAAASIVSEFLGGTLETESADENVHIIIPNWSPFNAIAWMTKIATKNNAADYVFFQKDNSTWVMKSLERLYSSNQESTGVKFVQKPAEIKVDGEYETDYTLSISNFHVEHFDGASNLATGFYRNKKVSLDLINKVWETKTFTYGDDCPEDAAMKSWDSELFDDAEDANITFMPKHPGMHQKQTYLDKQDTWEPSRKSALQKLDQERFIFQVPGSAGVHNWIGKNCEIELPSHQDIDHEEKYDKYRKGKYCIIAIAHNISKAGYTCNFECIKKRLEAKV